LSPREGKHRKQVHLAVDADAGDHDFDTFARLAGVAERGMFDFILLAGGPLTVLAALAGVTEHLGLVGTTNTTHHEPFEVSRQFATLDHISDGRAGWNISSEPSTATSFRRGDHLDHADRYRRGAEFIAVARAFWDSWAPDAVLADIDTGIYADPDRIRPVDYAGSHFEVRGLATLPAGPQGHPVLLQAGDSDDGREFGVEQADVLVTPHSAFEAGQRYYTDVKARAAAQGRNPDQLIVFSRAPLEQFHGTASEIAEQIDLYVQSDACDGFILPSPGLADFVDGVVPLLQERGVFRTEYRGQTLRENLGLSSPG
jgi:alkanesulfonate monooxygenase SsuD/methylene tetrahydromethanopterin reductase-like flavin-dependent oxidoreductase (luciferase family)